MPVLPDGTIVDEFGKPTGAGTVDVQTGQLIAGSGTITGQDLQDTPRLDLPPVQPEPNYTSVTGAIPIPDLNRLFGMQPTKAEQIQDDLSARILELSQKFTGRQAAQFKAEEAAGVSQLRTQLQDAINQLQSFQKEAAAVPLQIQEEFAGRGVTKGGVAPIETGRLRQISIRALGVSAIAQALQGNLGLAQQQANRAVELEFGPMEAQLQFLDRAIEVNKFRLSREDARRAEARQLAIAERNRIIQEKKEERTSIFNASIAAAQMGADMSTLNKINSAKTREEALSIAGYYMGQEFRKKLEQEQFTRNLQVAQYNLSLEKFDQDAEQFDLQYALSQKTAAIQEMKALAEIAQNQGFAGANDLNLLAYAQQYAADGKAPTGMPKNSFGVVSQKAKEIPKPKGTIVDINTGVKSSSVSDTLLGGYGALYSIVELANDLKELNESRMTGVVAGTLGKVFGSEDQQKYIDLRTQIVDLLSRARSGAALTTTEETRYSGLLPGRFAEPFFLGPDAETKINNFITNITKDLQNKLATQGLAIYGFSKVNIQGQEFTVGDIININGIKGRILPDGSIATIE